MTATTRYEPVAQMRARLRADGRRLCGRCLKAAAEPQRWQCAPCEEARAELRERRMLVEIRGSSAMQARLEAVAVPQQGISKP